MSKYCIVLCFLLLGVTLSVSAQADCFSHQELQEMLTYDGHQLDSVLRSTGDWSFIDKEEKVKYILGNDTLELDMVVWQNFFVTPPVEIYLFYRDTTFQILEFSASKQCYQAFLMIFCG